MKPILLLNSGVAFSATSPLHYTLCWDNKYAHTGHCKEHHYLHILETGDKLVKDEFLKAKRQKQHRRKPPILCPDSEYVKFKGENFFCDDITIDRYISYYLEHWDNIKNDYKAVADFSNSNATLSVNFMQSIKDKLLSFFDVKVIMVFRDPVRRLFSVSNLVSPDPKDHIKMCVGGRLEPNSYYSDIYRRHLEVWGKDNVHPIIMEEFWAGDTKPLENFLDFPLPNIHENVYYPDMGSKAPHHPYLQDQWQSDKVDLDIETHKYCLEHLDYIYTDFAKTFGYIPEAWMK